MTDIHEGYRAPKKTVPPLETSTTWRGITITEEPSTALARHPELLDPDSHPELVEKIPESIRQEYVDLWRWIKLGFVGDSHPTHAERTAWKKEHLYAQGDAEDTARAKQMLLYENKYTSGCVSRLTGTLSHLRSLLRDQQSLSPSIRSLLESIRALTETENYRHTLELLRNDAQEKSERKASIEHLEDLTCDVLALMQTQADDTAQKAA